jgi:hypothetical protein
MNKNLVNTTLVMSAVFGLVACNQNPYPTGMDQQNIPFERHQVASPYTVEGPTTASCDEGKTCSITLIGHVPAPGSAVLKFTNLPAGAVYDTTTHVLTYTPDYSVVDVSADPTHTSKDLPLIGIEIDNSSNPSTNGSATLRITVNNTARPLVVNYVSGATTVAEGGSLDQVVNITSADFPSGPFHLVLDGAPKGTSVDQVPGTAGQFVIHYAPDNTVVTVADTLSGTTYVKKFAVKYNAFSLAGGQTVIAKDWTVTDARSPALVTAPDAITQGLNVNFAIRADDQNFEMAPVITVDQTNVPFGRLTVTPVVQTSSVGTVNPFTSVVNVNWDQLTAANVGTTTPIYFVVCVQSARNQFSYCIAKKTLVTIGAAFAPSVTEL